MKQSLSFLFFGVKQHRIYMSQWWCFNATIGTLGVGKFGPVHSATSQGYFHYDEMQYVRLQRWMADKVRGELRVQR